MKHTSLVICFLFLACASCFAHRPTPLTPGLNSHFGIKVEFKHERKSDRIEFNVVLDYEALEKSRAELGLRKLTSLRAQLCIGKSNDSFIVVPLASKDQLPGAKKLEYSFQCTADLLDIAYISFYPVFDPPQEGLTEYFQLNFHDWMQNREQGGADQPTTAPESK